MFDIVMGCSFVSIFELQWIVLVGSNTFCFGDGLSNLLHRDRSLSYDSSYYTE